MKVIIQKIIIFFYLLNIVILCISEEKKLLEKSGKAYQFYSDPYSNYHVHDYHSNGKLKQPKQTNQMMKRLNAMKERSPPAYRVENKFYEIVSIDNRYIHIYVSGVGYCILVELFLYCLTALLCVHPVVVAVGEYVP